MNKKSSIKPHVDGGVMLQLGRRIHIPLITNPKVIFEVFGESKYLEVGNWYEINNIIPHSVINDSEYDRVHFIIDLMPSKHLGEKKCIQA
jgi:aspartyl/asparaginyl beta-hydroxylase (cupin superfamily)